MATLLVHHETFARHQTSVGHPERPDRYRTVQTALGQPQFDALVRDEAVIGDLDATRYVHTNAYVDALEEARPAEGFVYLDGGDTMMEPSTWEVVLRGVGGTVQAVDQVLSGTVQNAFVACRPPGHHAETDRAMGFCLFNNISIGARHAQLKHGLDRLRSSTSTSITATAPRRSSTPIRVCCTPRRTRCRGSRAPGRSVRPEWVTSSTHRWRQVMAASN